MSFRKVNGLTRLARHLGGYESRDRGPDRRVPCWPWRATALEALEALPLLARQVKPTYGPVRSPAAGGLVGCTPP